MAAKRAKLSGDSLSGPVGVCRPFSLFAHIETLDDCFGQFLVHVDCECGAVREIEPEALARLAGPGGSNSRCNSIAIKIFQLRLEELETQQRASAASF